VVTDLATSLIRPINPDSSTEIELVAARMRQTLIEVISEEVGSSMYTMEWLIQRAKFHLDPAQCDGQIFVAELPSGEIVGHTIVRVEKESGEESAENGEVRADNRQRIADNLSDYQPNNQQPTANNDVFGLFSTFYVLPEYRGQGIATRFIETGEAWMRSKQLPRARTYTAENNEPLHQLMFRHGYEIELRKNDMVSLVKTLS
jgi:GNAT superfamily N-acetyltransferase